MIVELSFLIYVGTTMAHGECGSPVVIRPIGAPGRGLVSDQLAAELCQLSGSAEAG